MFLVVRERLDDSAVVGERVQESVLHEPEPPGLDAAQDADLLDNLFEHRLEALRSGYRAEDVADRALLVQLPLDGLEQPRVRDRDRRLIGKGLHQLDIVIGKRARVAASDRDHADQPILQLDRHAEQRAVADDLLRAERVLRIVQHVGDLLYERRQPHAADDGCPVARVRALARVFVCRIEGRVLRDDQKRVALRQVQLRMLAATQSLSPLGDLVQDRLEALAPNDGAQHASDRAFALARVLQGDGGDRPARSLRQPLPQLGVALESFPTFELRTHLADCAEPLGHDVVGVNRLHVELARV